MINRIIVSFFGTLVIIAAATFFVLLVVTVPQRRGQTTASDQLEVPLSVTTQDTSDWKTYRNEEYGFEVKYPNTYSIKDIFDKPKDFIVYRESMHTVEMRGLEEMTGPVLAIAENEREKKALRDTMAYYQNPKNGNDPDAAPYAFFCENVTIDNPQIKFATLLCHTEGGSIFLAYGKGIKHDYLFYEIIADAGNAELALQQVKEITSSFREGGPDISTWQTYHNERYGFEIKYPQNWNSQTEGQDFLQISPDSFEAATETSGVAISVLSKYRGLLPPEIYDGNHDYGKINFLGECKTFDYIGIKTYDCSPIVSFASERELIFVKRDLTFNITDYMQSETSAAILSTFKFIE